MSSFTISTIVCGDSHPSVARLGVCTRTAAVPAGRAMENYTEAYAQFGFLRRFAQAPDSADLRDARAAAMTAFFFMGSESSWARRF